MTEPSAGIRFDMPSSVRRLTALDHERLQRLLRRMCAPGPSQDRWRAEFVALLRAHRAAECEVVVAELTAGVPALSAAAREQSAADAAIDQLATAAEAHQVCQAAVDPWADHARLVLDRHAAAWDGSLMAPLEAAVARGEVRRLGGAYASRRDDELASAGMASTPPRRLDLSRAELYELARRAGIEGRSSMTRGQLIDELQRRQGDDVHRT